jgi:ParB-like chromosome segregation protein Spo0J
VVGARRREGLGELGVLARSLACDGRIQPGVIDAGMRLVAARRRLAACARLGVDPIDVRAYADLSADERRALEREENRQRKDLTPYELSKEMVGQAEDVAPAISTPLVIIFVTDVAREADRVRIHHIAGW